MSRLLLTGASGFIGRPLHRALQAEGHEVVALGREHGDISAAATLDPFEGFDQIIHLAASTFVPDSWKKPDAFFEANALGTMRVLEACRRQGASLVYISAYLYGIPDQTPTPESEEPKPNNPYAFSKYIAEQACAFYARYLQVPSVVVRPFNVYGPGQPPHFLIPKIIDSVLEGREISVLDLHPRRDYVYIEDLVRFIAQVAGKKLEDTLAVNIGSGISYSVAEVIEAVQRIAGTQLPVRSSGEVRFQEIHNVVADIRRAEESFGWKPAFSLEEGLKSCILSRQHERTEKN